jgi:RNA polymerase sigma-70 factor (ECF subfamily)
MNEAADFTDLLRRVRAGDQDAARSLVERYEPAIRTAVRVRLTDRRLRRVLDSMDICQSVLANFFVRAAAGQFELDKPEQLLGLLTTMARNKVTNAAERHQAARRDVRRQTGGDAAAIDPAAATPTPSMVVANAELLAEVQRRLDPREREIVERRAQGESWEALAERFGGTPDALRVKHGRTLDRIAAELKLED